VTLLTTEIRHHRDPTLATIIFAADRRLTRSDGSYGESRKKVLKIERLNAGIGYFGVAQVPKGRGQQYMDDWLRVFIRTDNSQTLRAFAEKLAAALNQVVPQSVRSAHVSGFHLAGFNDLGEPEFWFVRNVQDDRETVTGTYAAREDFQREHAPQVTGTGWAYRNGDIRAHVAVWERLDEGFGELMALPDFQPPTTTDGRAGWVKFKMGVIAAFYKKYCKTSIIGGPIDAFALVPRGRNGGR
jgi:hypothetical protein